MSDPVVKPATLSERVRIVVCTPNPASPPVIASLVKQMQTQKSVDFERVVKADEILPSVSQSTSGVVICTLAEKEELLGILNFLAKVEERLYNGTLRVMVISRMNHPKVNAILKAKGVGEILEYQVTIKALNLKLKNALLIVHQAHNKNKRNSKDRGGLDTGPALKNGRQKETPGEVIWDPPVEHACDFWLMTNKKNVRYVMGRWLIDVFGPGPAAGTWESSGVQFKGEVGWEWKPRDATNMTFQKESGRWIYFGRVPEFVWSKNSWAFVGKFARLAFYRDDAVLFDRFGPDEKSPGKLHIHENSENAKSMSGEIQATLEASVKFSEDKSSNQLSVPGDQDESQSSGGGFNFTDNSSNSNDENSQSSTQNVQKQRGKSGQSSRMMMMDSSFLNRRADVQALSFAKQGDTPAVDWNDHLGATGVNINAKNHRLPDEPGKPKWGGSNLLTPNETGLDMGFADLDAAGIKIDRSAFESIDFKVNLVSKNKAKFLKNEPIGVLDLTDGEALFDAPSGIAKVGDELGVEVVLTIGEKKTKLDLIGYAYKSEDFEDGRGLLICKFTNEYAVQFQSILKVFQDRQIELSHFFNMAKGA